MDRVSAEERLTPEARRRRLLRSLGLEESFLDYLRELPRDEAVWIISVERKQAEKFIGERYAFIFTDTIDNRPPDRPAPGQPVVVVEPKPRHSGSKIG